MSPGSYGPHGTQDLSQHNTTLRAQTGGQLFGIPLADLGWFTTLLMSFALGFAAFFASTFCAIVGTLAYNTSTHRALDYALTYRWVGLPVGVLVLLASLLYLGSLWVRRQLRRA